MTIIISIARAILNGIYALMKCRPLRNKITILSRESNEPSLDIQMLAEKFRELRPDWEVTVLCRKIPDGLMGKAGYCFHILTQMSHLAVSRACVLDTYCIPVSLLTHRKELYVAQMWHSVGTMKKFGYSILDQGEGRGRKVAEAMRMHKGYDVCFAAGEGYRWTLADGFGVPLEKIVIMPLPRVEALKDPDRREAVRTKIFEAYPELENGKEKVIYCPTFRKSEKAGEEFREAFRELCEAWDFSRFDLIVKLHPLQREGLDASGFPVIMDSRFSTMDMFAVADRVISDYSCVIYEAGILNLPLYFYAYDFDSYMGDRGTYIDYRSEMPGPVTATGKDTAAALTGPYDMDRLRRFIRKYVDADGQDETGRMASYILDHIE